VAGVDLTKGLSSERKVTDQEEAVVDGPYSVDHNLLKPDAPRSVWAKSGGWAVDLAIHRERIAVY
jgi:hypothetical protein